MSSIQIHPLSEPLNILSLNSPKMKPTPAIPGWPWWVYAWTGTATLTNP